MKTLRPLVALSLLITLSASKCEKKGGTAADLGNSRWTLQTLNTEQFQMPEGMEVPYLELDPSGSSVSGKAGCNKIHGQLKVEGSAISFPGLMGTKMACSAMDVETKFMIALNNANAFTLEGDKLTLLDKSKELATLARVKP
jgi:heat shock protein HslJ